MLNMADRIEIPQKAKDALKWIVGILDGKKIPYQISGGFSAKIYGSPRPLNDIDIDVPDERLQEIYEDVRQYVVYGPAHYLNGKWDLTLMTLNYHGQEMDIGGGDNPKVSNQARTEWVPIPTDFTRFVSMVVDRISINVIPPKELISYKQHLDGEHQKVDIEAVQVMIHLYS